MPRETLDDFQDTRVFEALGRIGWTIKGSIFFMMSFLAVQALSGTRGEGADASGAVTEFADTVLGTGMMWAIAFGFICYGTWRVVVAIVDSEGYGSDSWGYAQRASFVVIGGFYLFLSGMIFETLIFSASDRLDDEDVSLWAQRAMDLPAGTYILGAIGVGFFGVGLYQVWRSYRDPDRAQWDKDAMNVVTRKVIKPFTRVGLAARALAFGAVGFFLMRSAWTQDASEARDFGEAVEMLADEPVLLWIVVIGFFGYALHCLLNARYRRIGE